MDSELIPRISVLLVGLDDYPVSEKPRHEVEQVFLPFRIGEFHCRKARVLKVYSGVGRHFPVVASNTQQSG